MAFVGGSLAITAWLLLAQRIQLRVHRNSNSRPTEEMCPEVGLLGALSTPFKIP